MARAGFCQPCLEFSLAASGTSVESILSVHSQGVHEATVRSSRRLRVSDRAVACADFSERFRQPHLLAVSESQSDPATITVYITRTGEKYHKDGCRFLSRSKIPMP